MFRISRRLDYGLQLMVALAADSEERAQSTASLAERLQIPLPFLHQIGHTLMQAGMIKATPGPRGGLRLNQPPDSITILQIVETLEGKVCVNPAGECADGAAAPAGALSHMVWSELEDRIISYLESVRLDQLMLQATELQLFALPAQESVVKIS